MVAKKSVKKTRGKTAAGKKATPPKKTAKKLAIKNKNPKTLPKKTPKTSSKKAAAATKAIGKRTTTKKAASSLKKQIRKRNQRTQRAFSRERMMAGSGRQSGDLQGLSNVEGADSESVDELLEEGNAFEADVVKGVEAADAADEKEVHTHEVPADDVPDEYLES